MRENRTDEGKETFEKIVLQKLKAIERSIESLKESPKKQIQKQIGWLIMGLVMASLLSIAVNLWTSYFMLFIEPSIKDNPARILPVLIVSTIGLCLGLLYLTVYAKRNLEGNSIGASKGD